MRRTIFRHQQRLMSEGHAGPKLKDNAFNRERQAIKEHAAATSGQCCTTHLLDLRDTDNMDEQIYGGNSPSSEHIR